MASHESFLTGIDVPGIRHSVAGVTEYDDPICGKYAIADLAEDFLQKSPQDRVKIACVLAVRKRRGTGRFCTIVTGASRGELNAQNLEGVESLVAEFPRSVPEMLDECLINLSMGLRHPAQQANFDRHAHWWLYSDDSSKRTYFLNALESAEWIKAQWSDDILLSAVIQPQGWARLTELQRRPAGARNQAFVAMWFDPSMDAYFNEGILPAVEDDGTKCMRIDLKEHNNKICDEIIAEIRRSKYVVADFTGNRGGVYYEAGFASGLGIPVIWTVRERSLKRVHFDTRQFAHITYTTPEDLRTKLLNRIRATIT